MLTAECLNKILDFKFIPDISVAENITLFHLYNLTLKQTRITKDQLISKNEVFALTIPILIEKGYILETTETFLTLNNHPLV